MKEKLNSSVIRSIVLIFLCFLLTSICWLAWEYHLLTQVSSGTSDICTMVIGYLLQAAGIGLSAVIIRKREKYIRGVFIAALIVHLVCMVPALLSPYTAGTLVTGFIMNLACGIIAGYYLYDLGKYVENSRRATAFASGYALSIIVSWLISLIRGERISYSGKVIVASVIITAIVILFTVIGRKKTAPDVSDKSQQSLSSGNKKILLLLAALVIIFSIVNSTGFAFPSADLSGTVNVEFSRLIYAAGLIAAGFITDNSRKYGAVCALAALIIPFIILSLKGTTLPAIFFWALSYFIFGFYAVYRIILFSDLAVSSRCIFISVFGLMFGRIGDAVGEIICLVLEDNPIIMVIVTAVLFAAAVAVFFKVYSRLYIPEAIREQTEKEKFEQFSQQHDLSARERDMLHLILMDKTVNEIAEELSISDNTVKYHVKNILQKTGCRTRKDLIAVYSDPQNA